MTITPITLRIIKLVNLPVCAAAPVRVGFKACYMCGWRGVAYWLPER